MAKKTSQDEILSKAFFARMNKKFGEGTLMTSDQRAKIESVSTGSIGLDMALGVGGFPRGRISEIFGKEMSAKTTLALHAIANAQSQGILCAFIDAEHALDMDYAKRIGVDFKKLLLSQPDCGDDALNLTEDLIETGKVGYVVIDSVSALVPKAEIERQIGEELPGIQARMMSQALRKLNPKCAKFNTSIIFVNQIRAKIGIKFGKKTTTSGGNALKFYSTIRIQMKAKKRIKDSHDNFVASRMIAEVVKNKLAIPFRKAEFIIRYGKGIDQWSEIIDFLVLIGDAKKDGKWYEFNGEKFDGKNAFKASICSEKVLNYAKEYKHIIESLKTTFEEEEG